MEKKTDTELMSALIVISILMAIAIAGCETIGGFGRDVTYICEGYKLAQEKNHRAVKD